MLLLLAENLANVLGDGKLRERFALPDTLAIGLDGLVFVIEIGLDISFASSVTLTGLTSVVGVPPR